MFIYVYGNCLWIWFLWKLYDARYAKNESSVSEAAFTQKPGYLNNLPALSKLNHKDNFEMFWI